MYIFTQQISFVVLKSCAHNTFPSISNESKTCPQKNSHQKLMNNICHSFETLRQNVKYQTTKATSFGCHDNKKKLHINNCKIREKVLGQGLTMFIKSNQNIFVKFLHSEVIQDILLFCTTHKHCLSS